MKLKFLTSLSREKVDYVTILREIFKVKKLRWYHSFYFLKTLKKLSQEIEEIRKLNPKEIEEHPDCKIKRPESIDLIAFGAMIELQVLFQNPGEREIGELIIETISFSCYESHTKKPFDSESESFSSFKNLIANSDLVHMLGLYSWIDREINKSIEKWNGLFLNVRVEDRDWDNAGGKMMEKFHIINSIKKICSDFNLSYYEALKFPYALVQTSSLSDATKAFIQDRMRTIIQARMKSNQKQNQY